LSLGLLITGACAALVTFGALHAAVDAARGRVWEVVAWVVAALAGLGLAMWCVARIIGGEKPDDVYLWAGTAGPALITFALIARAWFARRSAPTGASANVPVKDSAGE